MVGMNVSFRGQCISSVVGKKVAYSKFATEPDSIGHVSEFQISCKDAVDKDSLQKLFDWEITGLALVEGTSAEGKRYAFFSAEKLRGKPVKV